MRLVHPKSKYCPVADYVDRDSFLLVETVYDEIPNGLGLR